MSKKKNNVKNTNATYTVNPSANNVVKEWGKIKWLSGKELLINSRNCLLVIAVSVAVLTGYDFLISLVMKLFN